MWNVPNDGSLVDASPIAAARMGSLGGGRWLAVRHWPREKWFAALGRSQDPQDSGMARQGSIVTDVRRQLSARRPSESERPTGFGAMLAVTIYPVQLSCACLYTRSCSRLYTRLICSDTCPFAGALLRDYYDWKKWQRAALDCSKQVAYLIVADIVMACVVMAHIVMALDCPKQVGPQCSQGYVRRYLDMYTETCL